jgi:glycosyltransferase involved in cell wall biosynthesis
MRVLLAGTVLGTGGIQTHIRWLARALGEAGVPTLALSLTGAPETGEEIESLSASSGPLVDTAFCGGHSLISLARFRRFGAVMEIIGRFRPDVYVAVGTGWNLFLPVLFCRNRPRLIFHEVMSGVPHGAKDSRWMVRCFFDEIVGQSEIVTRTFRQSFGWKGLSSTLAALPEPLEITAKLPDVYRRTVPLGQAKAAFFGRLAPHKNALWLVRQWDHLKDFLRELHIFGAGSEQAEIVSHITATGIGDRVQYRGPYPPGQGYVDLLSTYDFVLLPTLGAEGAPLVLLESMACGVPFVAYGVGGIPDYGRDNLDVIVVPPESNTFIEHVRRMADKLAAGQLDQSRLQHFYISNYSNDKLKQAWLTYLYAAAERRQLVKHPIAA